MAVVEADGVADVAGPVVGVGELSGWMGCAGEVGDDGDGGRVVGEAVAAVAWNSSRMGSMWGEWKAWLTRRSRVRVALLVASSAASGR